MTPSLRIIDANANRAREAFRVLEDIARFVLDDRELGAALKELRHDLRGTLEALPLDRAMLLAWRDTPGDVGTSCSTEGERVRRDLADVAGAAGSRLTEALRSIEEASKTLAGADNQVPVRIERIRYTAYELERRVLASVGPSGAPQWRLCVLVTGSLCAGRSREEIAHAAIAGGADCIQLREKDVEDAEFLEAARSIRSVTRAARVHFIVNDRPDIALLVAADGVHLGQTDLPVREARRLAGRSLLVGVSTSNVEQARHAAREGADYCGIGPMFATTTKHKPTLAGPTAVSAYLADPGASRLPHLAIGGITPGNVSQLAAFGVRGIAVSSVVCAAPDPGAVCRELRRALGAPIPSSA